MLARIGDVPVGCGAMKPYKNIGGEVKRMFVLPRYRNHSVGKEILDALEIWGVELGYEVLVLETGVKQPEATRLYEKCGFFRIPNYDQYEGVDLSICMKKLLNRRNLQDEIF